jgi:hypothetical protein
MKDTEPIAYPDSTILTTEQVARWVQVSVSTVKMWPIPRLKLPGSTVRFSAGMVRAYLEGRLPEYLSSGREDRGR